MNDVDGLRETIAVPLQRASRELRTTKQRLIELEHVVGRAIAHGGSPGPEQIRDLQRLDRIVQEIAGVADFLEALGASTSGEWRLDAAPAAARVSLGELSRRLGPGAKATEEASGADGDDELF